MVRCRKRIRNVHCVQHRLVLSSYLLRRLVTKSLDFTGPRACIGRKFATTEAVCYLAMLLRDFTVRPIMKLGETKLQWKERVLDAKVVMTLGVQDVPVRFTRRK